MVKESKKKKKKNKTKNHNSTHIVVQMLALLFLIAAVCGDVYKPHRKGEVLTVPLKRLARDPAVVAHEVAYLRKAQATRSWRVSLHRLSFVCLFVCLLCSLSSFSLLFQFPFSSLSLCFVFFSIIDFEVFF